MKQISQGYSFSRVFFRDSAILLLLLGWFFQSSAQGDHYYYYGEQRIDLELSDQYIYLTQADRQRSAVDLKTALGDDFEVLQLDQNQSVAALRSAAGSQAGGGPDWAIIRLRKSLDTQAYLRQIEALKATTVVDWASPFFRQGENDMVGLSQYFYVKLRDEGDLQLLRKQCKGSGAQIVGQNKYMPRWYTLQVDRRGDQTALDLANRFYESGLFAFSEPSLMVGNFGLGANDPLFPDQWGMEHTGQNGWPVGNDMRACGAWALSQGSREIVVAVLDSGIDPDHPDLTQNLLPQSYNTITASSPSVVYGHHGTNCAGIIAAAQNNSRGVSGIAPNVRLLDISHTLTFTPNTSQELADGINWAWMNGADVISNSWGDDALASTYIDDAITTALNFGRGGLGAVVVFAAGNTNRSVIYPASSNPDIVTVAAMSPCGARKSAYSCDLENWGSSFGAPVDVMAPGVKIMTTDNRGTAGVSTSDYNPAFRGTSAACPAVAGIAGLILSINYCLDHDAVEDLLEQNARKVGGYPYATVAGRPNGTWYDEVGYGLGDAEACIADALTTLPVASNGDLLLRDRSHDTGLEPNPDSGPMWISDDIWVREHLDGLTEHQNPKYKLYDPNGVYVRITNAGTTTSPCATLAVYCSKAATGLVWPTHWDNFDIASVPYGEWINTVTIPPISPGGTYIAELPWYPPNPIFFSTDIHHFGLAARIVSPADPMYNEQLGINISPDVRINNTIAWKNVSILHGDLRNSPESRASVFIRSARLEPTWVDLYFHDLGFGENIAEPFFDRGGQVLIETNTELYAALMNAGLVGIELDGNNTLRIHNREALVKKLFLPVGANYSATFRFELPEYVAGDRVIFDFIQKETATGQMVGGERFVIATDGAANIGGGGPEWSLRERQVVTSFLTPNPVADELTLNYALSSEAGSVSWRIVDLSGRQVLGAELGQGAAHGHYVENIDVARLSAGIYLFTLRVGAEWRTEKLVVQ